MSAARRGNLLVIGIGKPPVAGTGWSEQSIKSAVEADIAKVKNAGFDIVPYFADPKNESVLEEVKELLRKQPLEGVFIGFGLRGTAEYTPLFEDLVNASLTETQKIPKMMFPRAPNKIFESLQRVLP